MKQALLVLFLASLACSAYFETPANATGTATKQPQISTQTPRAASTASERLFSPVGTVYVRSCPALSCPVVGYLEPNKPILASCNGDWCRVANGYVVAACLGIGDKPCQRK